MIFLTSNKGGEGEDYETRKNEASLHVGMIIIGETERMVVLHLYKSMSA